MNLAGQRWGDLPEDIRMRLLSDVEIEADTCEPEGRHKILALFIFKEQHAIVEGTIRMVLGLNHTVLSFSVAVDDDSVLEELEDVEDLMGQPRSSIYS
ncbi:MAG: hypothetical protein LKI76_03985 [Megasphaera sp.]|jgi:hypothetical protein|uniref:Uncharacterized protein n=1 Tax=Megasphaera paucivorans TaxID=349095 RepID=A0A1G9SXN7_9FIRM|nr:hypothetical protein [Megasphaera paucivorans]MCI1820708.1 hypothetical protein [Megasphaera sp.]MCI1823082.1 hypothetical protein [Megasphaera sp.]SDM39625.1 hypothetical protein SAMN05660299_00796 [Megasphaera paucivorans]